MKRRGFLALMFGVLAGSAFSQVFQQRPEPPEKIDLLCLATSIRVTWSY